MDTLEVGVLGCKVVLPVRSGNIAFDYIMVTIVDVYNIHTNFIN